MPKALIFYTAHTIGHKKIAENLGYWLEQLGWHVELRDALATAAGDSKIKYFLKLHTYIYSYTPSLWRWAYNYGYKLFVPLLKLSAKKYVPIFLELIRKENPNLIITTQISPSSVMAEIKKQKLWKGKWAIAFSDFHFHPAWAFPEANGYLVNIQEQQDELLKQGQKKAAVVVGGMWTKPRPRINRNEILKTLGIEKNANVVLVSSGSGGWVDFTQSIEAIRAAVKLGLSKNLNIQPVVVCGKNQKLLERLKHLRQEGWIVLGWQKNMHELYAISSLFITKPGGLSIAEALQWQLPCLIPFLLPGQEDKNLDYLNNKKLIVPLKNIWHGSWPKMMVKELSTNQERLRLAESLAREEIIQTNLAGKLSTWLHMLFHTPEKDV